MIDRDTALRRAGRCCYYASDGHCAGKARHARGARQLRTTGALALLVALTCGTMQGANAHGWLAVPAARNLLHLGQQGFWQQMSLNR